MARGQNRGSIYLSVYDLALAKTKISRPEDWEHMPGPGKYFVQFFSILEITFVAHADIQAFTGKSKINLSARCREKMAKYLAQAMKEICKEFDELQCKI